MNTWDGNTTSVVCHIPTLNGNMQDCDEILHKRWLIIRITVRANPVGLTWARERERERDITAFSQNTFEDLHHNRLISITDQERPWDLLWKCQRHFKRDQFKELEENVYQYSLAQTADGLALIETASPLSWPDTDGSLSDRRRSAPGSIAAISTPWHDIKGSLGKRCTKARPSRRGRILSEFNSFSRASVQ